MVWLARIGVLAGFVFALRSRTNDVRKFSCLLVPFSSISYGHFAANASGDHLVVGISGRRAPLSLIAANIPTPAFTNQAFCDAQVQLAPGQLYPTVYVPDGRRGRRELQCASLVCRQIR